jgi:preprotein translocase subunit SecE
MEKIDKAKQFFSEAKQELKKVSWPSRQQTITSTWVVFAVTAVLAIFLGLVDLVLSKLVTYIIR